MLHRGLAAALVSGPAASPAAPTSSSPGRIARVGSVRSAWMPLPHPRSIPFLLLSEWNRSGGPAHVEWRASESRYV